jgi:Zn-dependent M16 (insulinase) family peptidase
LDEQLASESALADLADQFIQLHERIKAAPCQILSVSEAEHQDAIAAALTDTWQNYPASTTHQSELRLDPVTLRLQQAWSTSTQVNFCAKVYPTVPQNHPDAPALQVLGECLRNGYLHRAVREQGGAYGVGASYQPDSGAFRFFSYRDPRLEETFADFDGALTWFKNTQHPARVLEEAILGIIASIDRPGSPAGEAISAFFGALFGRTPAQRRAYRQRVLQVTFEDLYRVVDVYLQPQQASYAVISNPQRLAQLKDFETLAI